MIFYFTGTGNSLYAAKKLAKKGERLIDMAAALKSGETTYIVPTGETVGFVFPVYCFTVNDVVYDFAGSLDLIGAEYVYAVVTCGGDPFNAGGVLKNRLAERGIVLSRSFKLMMPDNSMLFYDIHPEKAPEILRKADKKLNVIRYLVSHRKERRVSGGCMVKPFRAVYHLVCSTKGFHAEDSCIGCGLCARVCPVGAIEMRGGRPEWVKDKCVKCSACICRCPQQAVQFGKRTKGRNRYVNPVLK